MHLERLIDSDCSWFKYHSHYLIDRNGQVVGAIQVTDEDEMMLISDKGTLVRARASDVSIIGRNTQGVTLHNHSAYALITNQK